MQPHYTNKIRLSNGALRRPLRVNNVVRRLNLPDRTVRYLAQTGRLPAFKLDRKSWGFWAEDVDAFKRIKEADHAEVM